jgi:CelD/BcsL family acetyltransferase involved in cellulose biosynthesis
MRLTFTHDPSDLPGLASEWNALLARSATQVPFLRHEAVSVWWSTLGGGEWPGGRLWLGTAREADGTLVAIWPLFLPDGPSGEGRLHLLGSHEISDYLDAIAPAERTTEACTALLDALEAQAEVRGLDLYNLPEASPTLASMQAVASGRGWTAELQRLPPCPVVSLEGGWEAYLARLEKKQRHELRRKLRRADDHPEKVEMRIVSPAQDVGSEMESFLGLMALGDAKARFLQPAMRRQFVALTHEAHRCGCLNLAFLDVGGVPAAAYWSFDYGNRLWVYNSGLNPAYSSLSPGWVLLGRLIQWAIDAGRTELDFLRGDEDYKYRLGGVERAIFRLTLMR